VRVAAMKKKSKRFQAVGKSNRDSATNYPRNSTGKESKIDVNLLSSSYLLCCPYDSLTSVMNGVREPSQELLLALRSSSTKRRISTLRSLRERIRSSGMGA